MGDGLQGLPAAALGNCAGVFAAVIWAGFFTDKRACGCWRWRASGTVFHTPQDSWGDMAVRLARGAVDALPAKFSGFRSLLPSEVLRIFGGWCLRFHVRRYRALIFSAVHADHPGGAPADHEPLERRKSQACSPCDSRWSEISDSDVHSHWHLSRCPCAMGKPRGARQNELGSCGDRSSAGGGRVSLASLSFVA